MAEKEEKKVLRVRVGDFSFQVALKDIDLECRVCKKAIVDPPIYCCDDDHCFCYTCYEKLFNDDSNCPVCVCDTIRSPSATDSWRHWWRSFQRLSARTRGARLQ